MDGICNADRCPGSERLGPLLFDNQSCAELQAWTEAVKGVRGGRLEWPVFLAALGASACPVQARAELAGFIRLLASGVRPAAPPALLSIVCIGLTGHTPPAKSFGQHCNSALLGCQ